MNQKVAAEKIIAERVAHGLTRMDIVLELKKEFNISWEIASGYYHDYRMQHKVKLPWYDYYTLQAFPGLGVYHMACRMTGHKALYIVDDFGVMQELKFVNAYHSWKD